MNLLNQRKNMKKVPALVVTFAFILSPVAFAEEVVTPTGTPVSAAPLALPPSDMTPTEPVPTDGTPVDVPVDAGVTDSAADSSAATSPDIQTTDTPVDNTATTQETIDSSVLENTADPAASSTAETIPLATSTDPMIDATSTPLVAATDTSAEEPVDVPIQETVPDVVDTIVPVAASADAEVLPEAPVRQKEILLPEPDPSYVFSFSGKTIPTKRQSKSDPKKTETIRDSIVPQIDNVEGTMHVSGSCASPYFVVLLFKNQDDYTNDPRSFIVNRAYPCENGTYSYSIDRLPPTLPNGTYYLMVGEQGESGPWTPATGLTEITINRNTQ